MVDTLPGNNKPLISIFLIVAVDVVGFAIMLPLLPFYVERTGATAFTVGLMISAYALCQLLAGPVLGQLSDRIGRKPVLMLSQVGTLIGFIVLALANTIPLIFLARIIDGLTAGNISVAQAYVSDNTAPAQRTKAFGIIGAAFGVGLFLGPTLSAVLAKRSLHAPIWAACVMSALSIVATTVLLPKGITKDGPVPKRNIFPAHAARQAFTNPATSRLFLMLTSFMFSFVTFTSGLALFLSGRITWHGHLLGPQSTGLLFAYAGLLNIVLQAFLLEKIVRFASEKHIILCGFLLMCAGYTGLAFSHTLGIAVAFLTLNNIGAGVLRPVITSQISKKASPQQQGMMMGVNQSVFALSQTLAPLLTGVLIEHQFYTVWGVIAAVFSAVGVSLALSWTATSD